MAHRKVTKGGVVIEYAGSDGDEGGAEDILPKYTSSTESPGTDNIKLSDLPENYFDDLLSIDFNKGATPEQQVNKPDGKPHDTHKDNGELEDSTELAEVSHQKRKLIRISVNSNSATKRLKTASELDEPSDPRKISLSQPPKIKTEPFVHPSHKKQADKEVEARPVCCSEGVQCSMYCNSCLTHNRALDLALEVANKQVAPKVKRRMLMLLGFVKDGGRKGPNFHKFSCIDADDAEAALVEAEWAVVTKPSAPTPKSPGAANQINAKTEPESKKSEEEQNRSEEPSQQVEQEPAPEEEKPLPSEMHGFVPARGRGRGRGAFAPRGQGPWIRARARRPFRGGFRGSRGFHNGPMGPGLHEGDWQQNSFDGPQNDCGNGEWCPPPPEQFENQNFGPNDCGPGWQGGGDSFGPPDGGCGEFFEPQNEDQWCPLGDQGPGGGFCNGGPGPGWQDGGAEFFNQLNEGGQFFEPPNQCDQPWCPPDGSGDFQAGPDQGWQQGGDFHGPPNNFCGPPNGGGGGPPMEGDGAWCPPQQGCPRPPRGDRGCRPWPRTGRGGRGDWRPPFRARGAPPTRFRGGPRARGGMIPFRGRRPFPRGAP